jgi:hypothetical protein
MVVVPVRRVLGANKYPYNYNASDEINEWVGAKGGGERITCYTHLHSWYLYKKQTQAKIYQLARMEANLYIHAPLLRKKKKERKER